MLGARMHGRDYLADIGALAPYARAMHLWNTRGEDFSHTPLHPSQSPAYGWIDLERTLETVVAANPQIAIVFEYPVEELTPDIQAGYDWIADLVAASQDRNKENTP
jgi:predicted deacylase